MANSSKRFGSRYGSRIRKNVDEAEERDYKCPECGSEVDRNTAGVWECTKCDKKFAGGAYSFETGAQEMIQKALELDEGLEELEEAKEEVDA